jgi:hypothetical protein
MAIAPAKKGDMRWGAVGHQDALFSYSSTEMELRRYAVLLEIVSCKWKQPQIETAALPALHARHLKNRDI